MFFLNATVLQIMFGEGAEWPMPTRSTYVSIAIFFSFIILSAILVKIYYKIMMKKHHEEQLFLFKARQKGLTEYQSKIVQGMAKSTGLNNLNIFLEDEILFENSIASFLSRLFSLLSDFSNVVIRL